VVAVTERPDATRCGAGVAQGEGGRIVEAEKYENGGPPRGHDFSSRPYRPSFARGSAILASRPPGGNYFTDYPKLRPNRDEARTFRPCKTRKRDAG
jgi:hypothetical protein